MAQRPFKHVTEWQGALAQNGCQHARAADRNRRTASAETVCEDTVSRTSFFVCREHVPRPPVGGRTKRSGAPVGMRKHQLRGNEESVAKPHDRYRACASVCIDKQMVAGITLFALSSCFGSIMHRAAWRPSQSSLHPAPSTRTVSRAPGRRLRVQAGATAKSR